MAGAPFNYFGGGGPGAGVFQNLFNDYLSNYQRASSGVGMPALAASGATDETAPSYYGTPFSEGGHGTALSEGAFSNLASGLFSGEAAKEGAQSQQEQGDISSMSSTGLGYSDALSGAIANAINSRRLDQMSQLQDVGLFSALLNSGVGLGRSLFAPPGALANFGTLGNLASLGRSGYGKLFP